MNKNDIYAWKIPCAKLKYENIPLNERKEEYYYFDVQEIDTLKLIDKHHFLKWLFSRHQFESGIIKMEPNKIYDWHEDSKKEATYRGVCINALLSPSPSLVLWSNNLRDLVNHGGDKWQADIVPFQYELNELYLFNPTIMHSVYNFQHPRLLFSLQFKETVENLKYEELLNEIKNEYIG
jgi:hypothetical protein